MIPLTDTERRALYLVKTSNLHCDDLPRKLDKDLWGDPIPGEKTYRRLEAHGLLIFTEPLEMEMGEGEEPFVFSAFLELTPEGHAALAQGRLDPLMPQESPELS